MRISDWSSDVCSSDLTEYGSDIVLPLDVSSDEQIDACFTGLGKHWTDGFDILVHCNAYATREAIGGDFLDGLTRENFAIDQDILDSSLARSEERRDGKEWVSTWRSRWTPDP